MNRLTKTKVVRDVDHEAERVERLRMEGAERRAAAVVEVRYLFFEYSYFSDRRFRLSCTCVSFVSRSLLFSFLLSFPTLASCESCGFCSLALRSLSCSSSFLASLRASTIRIYRSPLFNHISSLLLLLRAHADVLPR